MNRDSYIRQKHPHLQGGQQPLFLLVHNAVTDVTIPIGWSPDGDYSTVEKMSHIRNDVLRASDRTMLDEFSQQLRRTEAFLSLGNPVDGFEPTGDDVRRLFSFAYHLLNEDDPRGKADRDIFATALRILELGEILPDRTSLRSDPSAKPPGLNTR